MTKQSDAIATFRPAPCATSCEANAFYIELRARDSRIADLEAKLAAATHTNVAGLKAWEAVQAKLDESAPGWNASGADTALGNAFAVIDRLAAAVGNAAKFEGIIRVRNQQIGDLEQRLAAAEARTPKAVEAMKRRCLDTAEMSTSLNSARGAMFLISEATIIAGVSK